MNIYIISRWESFSKHNTKTDTRNYGEKLGGFWGKIKQALGEPTVIFDLSPVLIPSPPVPKCDTTVSQILGTILSSSSPSCRRGQVRYHVLQIPLPESSWCHCSVYIQGNSSLSHISTSLPKLSPCLDCHPPPNHSLHCYHGNLQNANMGILLLYLKLSPGFSLATRSDAVSLPQPAWLWDSLLVHSSFPVIATANC